MRPFAYARAASADGAIATLRRHPSGAYLAGGTNVVDLIKLDVAQPDLLVDVNLLPYASIDRLPDGSVRIGALARMSDTADHPLIRENAPAVSSALLQSASAQLRNMASIGGNVLQRTRCPYFRDTATPCNKRRNGEGCSATGGDDRTMAILGASASCIATHPSDFAVAMIATDATIHLRGPSGERTVPFAGFHRLPGSDPTRDTIIAPGELITGVSFVPSAVTRKATYLKVRDRASYEFALVSVAAGLDVQGGTIRAVRLALGGVAHAPWRAQAAEAALIGKAPTRENFLAAADAELRAAKPQRLNAFKVPMARNAIARALATAGATA
ncbi:MAG TPA: xanthine dehydrogenase family protein subunit M [Candidatus Elarobacter sp.]|jgi:xanthine dehydrogenase YagS FAD-binding subunit